eukprot:NODE_387_length_8274_cov_0.737125.p3 type:complete len:274 gc:universal NODE_387_length_8274_cov_0.737125:3513-4334(+)
MSFTDIQFGDFNSLCSLTSFPVCKVFGNIVAKCSMQPVLIFGGNASDLGQLLSAFACLLGVLTICYRTHTKYAAVGRLEMNILNVFYLLILITEMGLGVTGQGSHSILSALNGGFITGFFWTLLINSIILFQIAQDGTYFSFWGTSISSSALSVCSAAIIYTYGKQNSSVGIPIASSSLLFLLVLVFPAVCAILYFIFSSIVLGRKLNNTKATLELICSAILMIISVLFTFVFNNQICTQSIRVTTGAPFGVLFAFLSFTMLHRFWCNITECN